MILLGLNDLDIDGEWLVERQALWVVPPELKESLTSDAPDPSDCFYDPLNQEVYVFKLEDCALKALQQVTTQREREREGGREREGEYTVQDRVWKLSVLYSTCCIKH